jgi:hypothetical protein
LRRQDIKLWCGSQLLPHSLPLHELQKADGCTINLANQKNGHKNCAVHHSSSGVAAFDPVQSMVRLVHAIQGLPPTTPLGSYQDDSGKIQRVTATEVGAAVKLGAVGDNLLASGYDIQRIGTHSIRSGGAVHLKLCGYDSDVIKKLGRWSSNTYLHYIQSQIANVTTGIACKMAQLLRFQQVGT